MKTFLGKGVWQSCGTAGGVTMLGMKIGNARRMYSQEAGVPGNVQCTARRLVSKVMYSVQPGGWCPR